MHAASLARLPTYKDGEPPGEIRGNLHRARPLTGIGPYFALAHIYTLDSKPSSAFFYKRFPAPLPSVAPLRPHRRKNRERSP